MNILVSIISTLNKHGKNEITYNITLEECDIQTVSAYHTNESIFKTFVQMKEIKETGGIHKNIVLVSNAVLNNKNELYDNQTAYEYYENLKNKISPDTELVKIPTENQDNTSRKIAEILNDICGYIGNDDVVYIDSAGGRRTTSNVIQLLVKLLKYKGIQNPYSLYSDINGAEKNISDTSAFLKMTDLLDAFNEFMTTGKSYKLSDCLHYAERKLENLLETKSTVEDILNTMIECPEKQLDSRVEDLLKIMIEFSDKIQLGNIDNLDITVKNLKEKIKDCEKITDGDSIELVILKQFLPVIKEKLLGDEERINYAKIVKWCLENYLIQQALTIFVEKIPVYLFEEQIIKYKGDIKKAREEYKNNRTKADPSDWETKVFYTDMLTFVNPDVDQLIKWLKKGIEPTSEKAKNATEYIKKIVNNWGNLPKIQNPDSKMILLINHVNKSGHRDSKKFINDLQNAKKIYEKLLDIDKNQHIEGDKTIYTKFQGIENIRSGAILPEYCWNCSSIQLASIYYGYIYVKAFRNQINHASSDENLTEEQKNFLENLGYSMKIDLLTVKKNIEFALNKIENILTKKQSIECEEPKDILPTTLKIGDIVKAKCVNLKIVRIENHSYDIQLIAKTVDNPFDLVEQEFNVKIKQISKAGKIIQVEYFDE